MNFTPSKRFRSTAVAGPAAAALCLLLAPAAGATTMCVPTYSADCPNNGTNVEQGLIQVAVQSAGNDGQADEIVLAPGTVTSPGSIAPSGNDDLTIRGAGADQTTVTTSTNGNIYLFNLEAGGNGRSITVRDLTVFLPGSMNDNGGAAFQVAGDTIEDVDIVTENAGSNAIPSWVGGGTFRGGEIRAQNGGFFYDAFRTNAGGTGEVLIEDATVTPGSANAAVRQAGGMNQTVTVRRSRFLELNQSAVTSSAGVLNLENSVITTAANSGTPLYALANSATDAVLNVDHSTLVNDGANLSALVSQVAAGQSGNAEVNVSNSIMWGHAGVFLRNAPVAAADGDADINLRYSDYHLTGTEAQAGDGHVSTVGSIDADPMLTADHALQQGSPSIDAADTAGTLADDITGATRPIDGNADGDAVSDMGAFEFTPAAPPGGGGQPGGGGNQPGGGGNQPGGGQPADTTAPETTITKRPKARLRSTKARFGFASSEDGSTFECKLDKAAYAPCKASSKFKRLKARRHKLLVRATDAAGNVDPTPAKSRFRVTK